MFEMRMYTMEDGDMSENMAYARGVTNNLKYSLNRVYTINRLVTTKEDRYTYYFDIFQKPPPTGKPWSYRNSSVVSSMRRRIR